MELAERKHKQQTITALRESLRQQLQDMGADVAHFEDQIDDYIFLVQQLRKMQTDIRQNGLRIEAVSASGKEYMKDNPSIKMAALYTREKRALLRDMGLTTDTCLPPEDGESDL